jgi:hypothetical protein
MLEVALTTLFGTAAMILYFMVVATIANKYGKTTKWVMPIIVVFVICDWIYNWTLGSILCLQLPKEWDELATKRLKRYKKEYDLWDTGIKKWRWHVAFFVCKLLSQWDEDHC